MDSFYKKLRKKDKSIFNRIAVETLGLSMMTIYKRWREPSSWKVSEINCFDQMMVEYNQTQELLKSLKRKKK